MNFTEYLKKLLPCLELEKDDFPDFHVIFFFISNNSHNKHILRRQCMWLSSVKLLSLIRLGYWCCHIQFSVTHCGKTKTLLYFQNHFVKLTLLSKKLQYVKWISQNFQQNYVIYTLYSNPVIIKAKAKRPYSGPQGQNIPSTFPPSLSMYYDSATY